MRSPVIILSRFGEIRSLSRYPTRLFSFNFLDSRLHIAALERTNRPKICVAALAKFVCEIRGLILSVTRSKWEVPPILVIRLESADMKGQYPFIPLIYRRQGLVTDLYPNLNDEEELIRLDTLHALMRSLFGRNVIAQIGPLEPNNILDIGAGSGSPLSMCLMAGAWALEVAQEYPGTLVIGMDLSPIQRQAVPPNCIFMVGDLTKDLVEFHNGSFDLVHSRYFYPED
jgi:hypothetical protein